MNIAITLKGDGTRADILKSLSELQASLAQTIDAKWSYEDSTLTASTHLAHRNTDSQSRKLKLIEAIQAKGSHWDQLAISDAIESARKPDDAELKKRASVSVARSDNANKMAEQIVELVHMHWVRETSQ